MNENIFDPLGDESDPERLEAELARAEAVRDALLAEAANYRRAFEIAREHAGVSVWNIDLQARTLMLGTESSVHSLDERLHPDDVETMFREVSRSSPDEPDVRMKLRMKGPGERWDWFRFDGLVERFDSDGRPQLLIGVGKNISDEILLEENLAEDERLLEELLDNSVAILYRHDSNPNGAGYFNSPLYLHAVPSCAGSIDKVIEEGLESIHPDDRERIDAALGQNMASLNGSQVTSVMEYRRADLKGEYHWYYDIVTLIPDRKNAVQTMLGSALEITALKEAEATLRASEERYRLVTTLSSFIIWTTDLEMNFRYCSLGVKNMLGYTAEEVIALGPRKTLLPESYRLVVRLAQEIRLQEAKRPGSFIPRYVQLWQRHKNGMAVLTEVAVSVVHDESGRLEGFCGVTRDITEFHHMKEALRTEREMLENRVLERTAELLRA
ncbi:MAG TPA: PAS domain-containing protein, partial [Candidatus Ozemobacteraceae bacterium]|nr:PAS domain-containing protein [Candidatus Ozemobacteraceae bacterium]